MAAASGEPKLSIIVPVFNGRRFIGRCLKSALSQTEKAIEVICIDDGSTDGTREIVEKMARRDGRLRVLIQDNGGPGRARNLGLSQAQGAYVHCLDADDFLDRTMAATVLSALEQTNADMAVFAFRSYNDRAKCAFPASWGALYPEIYPFFPQGTFNWRRDPTHIFEAVQSVPWNKVVRRRFLEDNAIAFQEIYLTEDALYSLPAAAAAQRIVRIGHPLVNHREFGGDSLMSDKSAHPLDFLDAHAAVRGWLEARGLFAPLRGALQLWLVNAIYYNLPTYRSHQGFRAAYDLLVSDDFRAFDLHDLDPSLITLPQERRVFEALRSGSVERFLLACANEGFKDAADEKCHYERAATPGTVAVTEFAEGLRSKAGAVATARRTLHGFVQRRPR